MAAVRRRVTRASELPKEGRAMAKSRDKGAKDKKNKKPKKEKKV
jgi:hypothetical protein